MSQKRYVITAIDKEKREIAVEPWDWSRHCVLCSHYIADDGSAACARRIGVHLAWHERGWKRVMTLSALIAEEVPR